MVVYSAPNPLLVVYFLGFMKRISIKRLILWLGGGLLSAAVISVALAACSNRSLNLTDWSNYFGATLLAGVFLWLGWRMIHKETAPAWLAQLTLGAFFLRLALGAVWFAVLPTAGYGTMAERNGYIFADAYNRDRTAWRVGSSSLPLTNLLTVRSYRKVDQYGGLLFLSSAYYRIFDGASHHPLLMIVLTASISALAVIFTWAFTKRAFGINAAKIAAWGMALYPEAVLLGSSQMREAFLIPLICLSFYGLIRLLNEHSWQSALISLAALILTWPFSPPASGLLLASLVVVGLFGGDQTLFRKKQLWIAVAATAVLVLAGVWVAWQGYAPQSKRNVFSVAAWWFKISAGMQARTSILDSGWMQSILESLPAWLHFPFLTLYGVLRPLLPAALVDISGTAFWQTIAIWRALGWTVLLAFLIVAPIMAFRRIKNEDVQTIRLARGLTLVVWAGILIASMRAGADLWDNPRYRAMFSGLQIALAAWVWVQYREKHDPWLKHILITLGLILIWFIPWYVHRYFPFSWPLAGFFQTVAAGLISVGIYFLIQFLPGKFRK